LMKTTARFIGPTVLGSVSVASSAMSDDAAMLGRGNRGSLEVNRKGQVTNQPVHDIWLVKIIDAALDDSHNNVFMVECYLRSKPPYRGSRDDVFQWDECKKLSNPNMTFAFSVKSRVKSDPVTCTGENT
jgi:hypothetical protein